MADGAESKVDVLDPIAAEVVSTILSSGQPNEGPDVVAAVKDPVQDSPPESDTQTAVHGAPDPRRSATRHEVRATGAIVYSVRHAPLPCIVQDMSDTGARLLVEKANNVPGAFRLRIEEVNLDVGCVVVWRTGSEIGVIFQAAQW